MKFSLLLTKELRIKLDAAAKKQQRSVGWVIRQAIEAYLNGVGK